MADCYVQGSVAFTCSNAEMALIETAFVSYNLMAEQLPGDPSPEFLAAFPPLEPDDPWSGFVSIFPDPDFPDLGVEFECEYAPNRPGMSTAYLYSTTDFRPGALAELIRHCCQETLRRAPIGFEWANSGSRPRVGQFGGGACAIFADRIVFETTRQMLGRALSHDPSGDPTPECGHWDEHPEHSLIDWQTEVANGDTRLGYHAWAAARAA